MVRGQCRVGLQKRATRSQEEGRLTQFIFCREGLLLSKSDQNPFNWNARAVTLARVHFFQRRPIWRMRRRPGDGAGRNRTNTLCVPSDAYR